MSADFSPGPWYLTGEDDRRYIRREESDECIALMLDGGHVDPSFALLECEIAANCNLIAAAPEMYAALERAMADLKDTGIYSFGYIDAALKRARGEQVSV